MELEEKFNSIKEQVKIEDVISKHVELEQVGHYLKGRCPFEFESTKASLTVSPEKGIFYCFNCHSTGDNLAFVSKLKDITIMDAANELSEEYGLELF